MPSLVNWHPRPTLLTLQQTFSGGNSTPSQHQVRQDRAAQSAEMAVQRDPHPPFEAKTALLICK
jgi:hypothetical protein